LFQATNALLSKAKQPKIVLLGSPFGAIGGMEKHMNPMFAYGTSKAAAHYILRRIHFEHQNLIAFSVDPG
jgi:norsolorinic acid ketoreductase